VVDLGSGASTSLLPVKSQLCTELFRSSPGRHLNLTLEAGVRWEDPHSQRRINRYTLEFKLSAVQLSRLRGVQIQDVAQALDIHPFMLSPWRKEAREGRLRDKQRKVVLKQGD
jgi:hypothetical protein